MNKAKPTLPVFRPMIVADKNKKRQSKSRQRQRTRLARIRAAKALEAK